MFPCSFKEHFSLVVNDVEHCFSCLFAIHISSFVKYLFIFLLDFYVFSFLSCVNFLYILDCIRQGPPEKQTDRI